MGCKENMSKYFWSIDKDDHYAHVNLKKKSTYNNKTIFRGNEKPATKKLGLR